MASLEFSGEQFTPECVREIRYEHIHRYAFAAELVRGRKVLDAACGEGYGARMLADSAATVTGVDISRQVIEHASKRYAGDSLTFVQGDCRALPFASAEFDCIVSFETLEHLEQQEQLLAEFRRVLAADGFLLVSSPDRATYTDLLHNDNPFHVRELYRGELEALLSREFPAVRLLGQRLGFQSLIWDLGEADSGGDPRRGEPLSFSWHREDEGTVGRFACPPGPAVYLLALCAADPRLLPKPPSSLSLFDDGQESVYLHYHHEIRKNMQAGALLEARNREIEALRAALEQSRPAAEPVPWWRRIFGGS